MIYIWSLPTSLNNLIILEVFEKNADFMVGEEKRVCHGRG